jgi:hypothetical protein
MQNKFGRRSFFGRVFSAAAGVSLLKISKPAAVLARAIPLEPSENLRSEESDMRTDTMISGREITGKYTIQTVMESATCKESFRSWTTSRALASMPFGSTLFSNRRSATEGMTFRTIIK